MTAGENEIRHDCLSVWHDEIELTVTAMAHPQVGEQRTSITAASLVDDAEALQAWRGAMDRLRASVEA